MQWISGTLELTSKVRYGINSHGHPLFRFIPYDRKWTPFAVASSIRDFSKNVHAIIEPIPTKTSMPRGSIVQLLGQPSEHTEKAMLLMTYAYDSKKDLKKILPCPVPGVVSDERERVDGYTFHIDPPGCRDVDDAFTFRFDGMSWSVYIHISDVDAWIPPTSPIDSLAQKRASTFYSLEGKALVPMFPPTISEETASLIGRQKPALSLAFTWTPGQPIQDVRWVKTFIDCTHSFTYDEASRKVGMIPELQALRDLSACLSADDPDSHAWVQTLMILYNSHAGTLLREHKKGILRRHSEKKQGLLFLTGETSLPFLLSSAEYVDAREEDVAHFGLQKGAYAYASSPIRRYCDLVNQRYIKNIVYPSSPPYEVDIPSLVAELNRRQKQEKSFTRDLFFMTVLSGTSSRVKGVAVSEKRVWVAEWKRCITVRPVVPGEYYHITWYENKNLPHWKQRIVFRADLISPETV